jgi:hypothetical protein
LIRRSLALAVVAAAVFLASCSVPEGPLVLWSNVPEVAFVVERYNHLMGGDVQFRYVENLTQALTQQRPEADVVIGRWVNTPVVNRLMLPRTGYFPEDGSIDETILAGSPAWIPLSFNLPTFVFDPDSPLEAAGSYALSLTDLAVLYGTDAEEIHFAPSMDADTLYALHRSLGFGPTADDGGGARWSEGALERAVQQVREWQVEHNGGPRAERAYGERYLYVPLLRQLELGYIGVVQMSSNRVFSWRFFDERAYAFRWLASPDGTVTIGEDIVYGGIPRTSDRRNDAVRFLEWITDPAVQTELVRAKIEHRVDSFGVLDGFSTIRETNRTIETAIHRDLAGRIPDPGALSFPEPLPQYWDEARSAVVEPLLQAGRSSDELATALDLWYRQRGD